MQAEFVDTS